MLRRLYLSKEENDAIDALKINLSKLYLEGDNRSKLAILNAARYHSKNMYQWLQQGHDQDEIVRILTQPNGQAILTAKLKNREKILSQAPQHLQKQPAVQYGEKEAKGEKAANANEVILHPTYGALAPAAPAPQKPNELAELEQLHLEMEREFSSQISGEPLVNSLISPCCGKNFNPEDVARLHGANCTMRCEIRDEKDVPHLIIVNKEDYIPDPDFDKTAKKYYDKVADIKRILDTKDVQAATKCLVICKAIAAEVPVLVEDRRLHYRRLKATAELKRINEQFPTVLALQQVQGPRLAPCGHYHESNVVFCGQKDMKIADNDVFIDAAVNGPLASLKSQHPLLLENIQQMTKDNIANVGGLLATYERDMKGLADDINNNQKNAKRYQQLLNAWIQKFKDEYKLDSRQMGHLQHWHDKTYFKKTGGGAEIEFKRDYTYRVPTRVRHMMQVANQKYNSKTSFLAAMDRARTESISVYHSLFSGLMQRDPAATALYGTDFTRQQPQFKF